MTDPKTRDSDPAIERQRREVDVDQAGDRAKADETRSEQRELQDRTRRWSLRGDGQAREALGRQRAAEDDSIRSERENADSARIREHALSDATLAREKDARYEAEHDAQRSGDRESRRTRELEEALVLVDGQLAVVSKNLSAMLEGVPRGPFEERLGSNVNKVRVAIERMQTLLKNVVVPFTRDDVPGGSG